MRSLTYAAAGLVAATLLVSCTKATKGFSVSASSRSATAATTGATSGGAPAAIDGGNGLSIDEVQLVVRRVEVEGAGACTPAMPPAMPPMPPPMSQPSSGTADDHGGGGGDDGGGSGDQGGDGGDGGDCQVAGGPFLVDLAGSALTSGGVHWVAALDVPAGTYREIAFKIGTITSAEAGTDAALMALADAMVSIKVTGTRDAAPFTFTTDLSATQKREGTFVVDPTSGANVTLDFDPSGWFKAADGSFLDPANPAAAAAIQGNIGASLRVVEDDNHDGEDDGDGHDG